MTTSKTPYLDRLMDMGAPRRQYQAGDPLRVLATESQLAALVGEAVDAAIERWRSLYRRAINEANGLTNYIEDRPELRRAERNLKAIQEEARALASTTNKESGL